jgi:uncharacterized membrane protein YfcA
MLDPDQAPGDVTLSAREWHRYQVRERWRALQWQLVAIALGAVVGIALTSRAGVKALEWIGMIVGAAMAAAALARWRSLGAHVRALLDALVAYQKAKATGVNLDAARYTVPRQPRG